MKVNCRLFAAGAIAAVLTLPMVGCQSNQNQNVQAARENNSDTDRTKRATLNDSDKAFLKKAEDGDIKERNIGRMVLEKSQNKDVRDYAQMLVDDHTKDLKKLVDLMEQKGMPQPKNLPEVKHEALDRMNSLSGAAMDREFVNMMVQDHQKDVADFRNEQNSTQDADVKHYVTDTLPVLENHLQKAQQLQQKVSGGSSGSQTR